MDIDVCLLEEERRYEGRLKSYRALTLLADPFLFDRVHASPHKINLKVLIKIGRHLNFSPPECPRVIARSKKGSEHGKGKTTASTRSNDLSPAVGSEE